MWVKAFTCKSYINSISRQKNHIFCKSNLTLVKSTLVMNKSKRNIYIYIVLDIINK